MEIAPGLPGCVWSKPTLKDTCIFALLFMYIHIYTTFVTCHYRPASTALSDLTVTLTHNPVAGLRTYYTFWWDWAAVPYHKLLARFCRGVCSHWQTDEIKYTPKSQPEWAGAALSSYKEMEVLLTDGIFYLFIYFNCRQLWEYSGHHMTSMVDTAPGFKR